MPQKVLRHRAKVNKCIKFDPDDLLKAREMGIDINYLCRAAVKQATLDRDFINAKGRKSELVQRIDGLIRFLIEQALIETDWDVEAAGLASTRLSTRLEMELEKG
jgi:hypothetical protein